MKIVYWSDFACPYCYIGKTRLKKAIARLEESGEIEPGSVKLEMRAFQLEPHAGEHAEEDTLTMFANKYRLSRDEAAGHIGIINRMGLGEGLEFKYDEARSTNTMDAHRLTKLVQNKCDSGLEDSIIDAIFHAYIAESKELADKSVLFEISEKSGMDTDEVLELLSSDDFRDKVVLEEKEAVDRGIHVVPTFYIGEHMIPGVIETSQFEEVLRKALEENA